MAFSDEFIPSRKREKVTPGSYRTAFFAGGNAKTASDVDPSLLFPDGNGAIRFEVSDDEARLPPSFTGINSYDAGSFVRLGEIMEHPKLFEAYPEMADMPVALLPMQDKAIFGAFSDAPGESFQDYFPLMSQPEDAEEFMSASPTGAIVINPQHMIYGGSKKDTMRSDQEFMDLLLSTLLHETQHAIDVREGFEYGWDKPYVFRPGEVTAHMVEDRRTLSPKERRITDGPAIDMRMLGKWSNTKLSQQYDDIVGGSRLSPEEMHKLMMEQAK